MPTELVAGRGSAADPATVPHTGQPSLDDPSLDAWKAFLHAHARLTRRLDEELQAAHGLSLAEYDALVQLVRTPGRRLRMSVLAERVLLSRSGVTRLVDRLVADGMVERSQCSTDARGAEAALTSKGHDRLREASGTHLEGVRRYFLEMVAPADQAAIARGLDAVIAGLDGPGTTDPSCSIADA